MSADRQRLTSAIRRIAKTDPEIRGLLDAADNKGGKPGSAGVGSSTDAQSQRICCDGSTSGSANPGTEERDPDSSTQSGLDSTDPAALTSGDGTLSGVTNCATGEPICFDGAGFIPPDGWDEPNEPPIFESYQEGTYWEYNRGPIIYSGVTASAVYSQLPSTFNSFIGCPGGTHDKTELVRINEDLYYGVYECRGGDNIVNFAIIRYSCGGSSESYCNPSDEDIRESGWPEDGCTNLAIKGGKIVGSKYDPENNGSYSAPREEIELCDPENGTRILVRPSSIGGWKSIKSLAGEPDGAVDNGYLYAKDGKRIRQISPSEFRDDTV